MIKISVEGGNLEMIKISVGCDCVGCPSGIYFPDTSKKMRSKILREQDWIVDGGNHFCRRECRDKFFEDKKFTEKRKTLTSKKK